MAKNAGDRGLSAALQHRKASGDFDKARSEKLLAHLRNGRHPLTRARQRRSCAVQDIHAKPSCSSTRTNESMSTVSLLRVLVALVGSLVLVSYVIASTASATAS